MTRASTAALAAVIVLLGTARVAADPPPAAKPPVPTADLPRIGTVGDFPAAPSAEVSVAADGGVFVDGELCDLPQLGQRLGKKANAPGMRDPEYARLSRLSVVLRVAAASRWDVVVWVLQTTAVAPVLAPRIFFAVRAEGDDSEGAIAMFLPRDRGIVDPNAKTAKTVALRLGPDGGAASRDVVFGAIREALRRAGEFPNALIDAAPNVSFAAAIETADLCLRAGAVTVTWAGSPATPPSADDASAKVASSPTALQRYVAQAGPAARGRRVTVSRFVAGSAPFAGAAAQPPKAMRARGVVGSTAFAPMDLEEEPPLPGLAVTDSIDLGLKWLKAHQSQDGGWEARGFGRWCGGKPATPTTDGQGKAAHDVGVTGLALLAFLGAGYTNRSDDANGFGKVVAMGLRYLKTVQDADGCFGPRTPNQFLYSHAIATLAMLEVYTRTRSSVYLAPARKGLEFTASARNPEGVWRYGVRPGDGDTSATSWPALGVHTARLALANEPEWSRSPPFVLDDRALPAIAAWLAKVTEADTGRVGYASRGTGPSRYGDAVAKFPATKSEANTAIRVLLGLLADEDPASESVRKSLARIMALPPVWDPADGSIDLYYWHAASLAMAALGGDAAEKWRRALESALTSSQRTDTDVCAAEGSWDPIDPWGSEGGRVYMTAMACLCLEAPARAARLMGRAK